MSASDLSGKIDFDDSEESLKKKIKQAYSLDGEVEQNGLMAMLKYVLFRYLHSKGKVLDVPRAEKFGGPQSFKTYEEAEEAFIKKELASGDLKTAITKILTEFLSPLRKVCEENKKLLKEAYPPKEGEEEANQDTKGKENKKRGKNKPKELTPYLIDIRVGQIVEIEQHPKSEKLFVEKIDVGEETPRTIISGLAAHYKLEELKGKKLLVMCNLKSVDIGKLGIVSHGMVIASKKVHEEKEIVKLVEVPENAVVGEKVTWSNLEKQEPEQVVKVDKLQKILKQLSSNEHGKPVFNGTHICQTTVGDCHSPLNNALLS